MYDLGIDLAARYSAAVLLSPVGEVLFESVADFDVASKPPDPRRHLPLCEDWTYLLLGELSSRGIPLSEVRFTIEDLSHFMTNPKPAIRVQAVMLNILYAVEAPHVQLVMANIWQSHYGYKRCKERTSKRWAKELALDFGYVPLDKAVKGKAIVDLRDAYLLARWAQEAATEVTT